VSARLAAAGGTSEWFRDGVVPYQPEVKHACSGAGAAVRRRATTETAEEVARLLGAQFAVSTTGVAGDEPDDGVPRDGCQRQLGRRYVAPPAITRPNISGSADQQRSFHPGILAVGARLR
jgi:hypothetical protein